MHLQYRFVNYICASFILLIAFTMVQQIYSFIQSSKNPISSIAIVQNQDGTHHSSTILFGAFMMRPNGSSRNSISFIKFNVSENCFCFKTNFQGRVEPYRHQSVTFEDTGLGSVSVLMLETPLDWRHNERSIIVCEHNDTEPVVFTFIIQTLPFVQFERMLSEMQKEVRDAYLNRAFSEFPSVWLHSNYYTSVMLSRTEFYREHRPDTVQINSYESSTTNVHVGQTRVQFAWREGFSTRIDKFNNRSIWSFALVFCSVLLGCERSYAFFTRARAKRLRCRPRIDLPITQKHLLLPLQTQS